MKKIYSLLIVMLLLASCGGQKEQSTEAVIATKDLTQIRAKKAELDTKQQELSAEIKQLSDEISKLDTNKKIPLISTFKVEEQNFTHYLELQGNVQTKQNVLVSPETNGVLRTVYVKEGQQVKKGANFSFY